MYSKIKPMMLYQACPMLFFDNKKSNKTRECSGIRLTETFNWHFLAKNYKKTQ
jgi:hypothetical protein